MNIDKDRGSEKTDYGNKWMGLPNALAMAILSNIPINVTTTNPSAMRCYKRTTTRYMLQHITAGRVPIIKIRGKSKTNDRRQLNYLRNILVDFVTLTDNSPAAFRLRMRVYHDNVLQTQDNHLPVSDE